MVWRWPGALPVLRPGFSKGGRSSWFRRRYRDDWISAIPLPTGSFWQQQRGLSGSSSSKGAFWQQQRELSATKRGRKKLEDDDDDDEAGLSLSSTGTQRRVLLAKRGEFSRRWGSDPTAESGEAGGTRERGFRSVCRDDAIDSLPCLVDDGMMGIRSCLRPRKNQQATKTKRGRDDSG